MLCSKPHMTKKVTGKMQAKSFPERVLLEKEIKTARQTRILQRIPREKAGRKEREIFEVAILVKVSPRRPEFAPKMPLEATRRAKKRLPSRFPRYTNPQFFRSFLGLIRRENREINIKLFPVKSSAPERTTMTSPPENTSPWTSFPRP